MRNHQGQTLSYPLKLKEKIDILQLVVILERFSSSAASEFSPACRRFSAGTWGKYTHNQSRGSGVGKIFPAPLPRLENFLFYHPHVPVLFEHLHKGLNPDAALLLEHKNLTIFLKVMRISQGLPPASLFNHFANNSIFTFP